MEYRWVVISDFHNPLALLQIPVALDLKTARQEFEDMMNPGPNPRAYETDVQKDWLKKVRAREALLVDIYGGTRSGNGSLIYSPLTFVNWLVMEKGVTSVQFQRYTMAEFD
jgi:hypothetical protein